MGVGGDPDGGVVDIAVDEPKGGPAVANGRTVRAADIASGYDGTAAGPERRPAGSPAVVPDLAVVDDIRNARARPDARDPAARRAVVPKDPVVAGQEVERRLRPRWAVRQIGSRRPARVVADDRDRGDVRTIRRRRVDALRESPRPLHVDCIARDDLDPELIIDGVAAERDPAADLADAAAAVASGYRRAVESHGVGVGVHRDLVPADDEIRSAGDPNHVARHGGREPAGGARQCGRRGDAGQVGQRELCSVLLGVIDAGARIAVVVAAAVGHVACRAALPDGSRIDRGQARYRHRQQQQQNRKSFHVMVSGKSIDSLLRVPYRCYN